MSHFRGKSAGQSLKWGITIIYDLSVLIYQRDFYRTAVNFLSRGACKARKSVFIAPYIRLPDSNNCLNIYSIPLSDNFLDIKDGIIFDVLYPIEFIRF